MPSESQILCDARELAVVKIASPSLPPRQSCPLRGERVRGQTKRFTHVLGLGRLPSDLLRVEWPLTKELFKLRVLAPL